MIVGAAARAQSRLGIIPYARAARGGRTSFDIVPSA
jgi:hypothetical protein